MGVGAAVVDLKLQRAPAGFYTATLDVAGHRMSVLLDTGTLMCKNKVTNRRGGGRRMQRPPHAAAAAAACGGRCMRRPPPRRLVTLFLHINVPVSKRTLMR